MPKPSGICNAESGLFMIPRDKAANPPSSNDVLNKEVKEKTNSN